MKRIIGLLAVLTAMTMILTGCGSKIRKDDFRNVMIYYGGGYNNLSPVLVRNIDELCSGEIPAGKSTNAILAFMHSTQSYGNYSTPNAPVLMRIYRGKKNNAVIDTVKVYNESFDDTDPGNIRMVLDDIRSRYPSEHYGMLYSSHATGWLPAGYRDNQGSLFSIRPENSIFPETKSIGAQFAKSPSVTYETELKDFADAIPMHLDYIIFDACLMGGIEVAYQLRNVCDRIVFSPTEILKQGLIYEKMAAHLMRYPADLEAVCEDYYNYYDQLQSAYSDCTITLADCRKADAVAAAMKRIIENHRDGIDSIDPYSVQKYYYSTSGRPWYFDLRDFAEKIGADDSELKVLDDAMASFVTYKAATDFFFDLPIRHFSGISCYIPASGNSTLDSFYTTLDWNKACSLLK